MSTDQQTHDEVSGARVLRGHQIEGSDLDSAPTPLGVLEVLGPLLARSPARVLLAGPRAALLVASMPSAEHVDVLVRALPDVRRISDLAGLRDGVRLYCGGIDAFEADHEYDLVVALGGPERLLGPDSVGLRTDAVVGRLSGLLRPGGVLAFDLANQLGLDDLVSGRPDPLLDSDEGWYVGAEGFDNRHLFAHERPALLTDHGLVPVVSYAALPSLASHRVLVHESAPGDTGLRERVAAAGGGSLDRLLADGPVLRDPRTTLRRVVEASLLDELAPAWLVVACRDHHPVTDPTHGFPLLVDLEPDSRWQVLSVVDSEGGRHRAWADRAGDDERSEGPLVRSLESQAPPGQVLEVVMREACAARNHTAVRSAVSRYAEWIRRESQWKAAVATRVFATPANVLVDGGGELHLADASWRFSSTVTSEEALVRGLRDFARRLLASAAVHPWRAATTPDELTVTLAAMVGVSVSPRMVGRVARIEGEMEALLQGLPDHADELTEVNLDRGRFARDLPVRDAVGYRELLAHDRAQARTLREKEGQVEWLEGTLRHRDRYIKRLERIIESYEGTLTYRTVQVIRAPRRAATAKAVTVAKTTANDVLPPEAMTRARRLAQRMLK
ncbi:MAG: hypothetical protein L0H96_06520 [Humibacillus sp.]|nr:hypothetical protein [Humibacillus sp.]MDN5776547.1 hypothetical protein [Humibacillus sp.]